MRSVRRLIDVYSRQRILLDKATVTLYEDIQEFWVAELDGRVVGCGALHVMWEDLAEIRTVAVDRSVRGRGIGHALVERLIDLAVELGLGLVRMQERHHRIEDVFREEEAGSVQPV